MRMVTTRLHESFAANRQKTARHIKTGSRRIHILRIYLEETVSHWHLAFTVGPFADHYGLQAGQAGDGCRAPSTTGSDSGGVIVGCAADR